MPRSSDQGITSTPGLGEANLDLLSQLDVLQVASFRVNLRAQEPTTLPAFLGSTLRGTFGHALKAAVCVVRHGECHRCLVVERCLYPYLFETRVNGDLSLMRGQAQAPHPYVMVPPIPDLPAIDGQTLSREGDSEGSGLSVGPQKTRAERISAGMPLSSRPRRVSAGEEIAFNLVLMGRAIDALPFVVYALSEMGSRGLGVSRGKFVLSRVEAIDEAGTDRMLYSEKTQRIVMDRKNSRSLAEALHPRLAKINLHDDLRIRFLTPARIRVDGDLQAGVSFELLVRNLLRRVSLLASLHGSKPLELDFHAVVRRAATVQTTGNSLSWWDWERYSNRQKTKMKLGGFVGEIQFQGEAILEFWPLLAAGELLHVGTGTSFGLGRYEIVD